APPHVAGDGALVVSDVGGAGSVARLAADPEVGDGGVVGPRGGGLLRVLRSSPDAVALHAVGVPAGDVGQGVRRLEEGVAAGEPALLLGDRRIEQVDEGELAQL